MWCEVGVRKACTHEIMQQVGWAWWDGARWGPPFVLQDKLAANSDVLDDAQDTSPRHE